MEVTSEGFSGSIESLEDFGRPFRQPVELPVSEVRILEASASGVGGQRVLTELEGAGSLCFSPLLLDSGMFVQNPKGSGDYSFDLPAMTEPALFRVAVESGMRYAAESGTTSPAIAFVQRGESRAVQRTQLPASR